MAGERWQYNVVEVKGSNWTMQVPSDLLQEQLNKLGAQGWELVTTRQLSGKMQLVLKRSA